LQPKLFGARVKRVEDPRFLMGKARYVDDIVRPGMLHAAFVRSPMAHADIVSVDVGEALAVPGVHAVVTGADIVGQVQDIRADSPYDGWRSSITPILANDRVRFVGEMVAAVVADDRYVAEDGGEMVFVDYNPREPVTSIEDALRDDAPVLHDGWHDNCFIRRSFKGGDPEKAFKEAHGTLDLDIKNNRYSGIPLETRGCVAEYDAGTEQLTLWTSTQMPHVIRTALADLLGLPEHRIRVISPEVGGGFGIKGNLYPEEVAVCLLAIQTGRPVKWIEDRQEHLMASIHAREHHHKVEVAYAEDGQVLALRAKIYVDCGAYSVFPWTAAMEAGMAMGNLPGPYRIRNYEADNYSVATNKSPLGPYRGVARPAAVFSIERVMDEVAVALGMDPIEVRRRNVIRPDEFPYQTITGLNIDSGSFIESLDKLCEMADYKGLRQMQEEARKKGRYIGIGTGIYTEQTGHTHQEFAKRGVMVVPGYDSIIVRMDPSGKVLVQAGAHNHGQGHETTIAQVVADQLTIPLEDVRYVYGDTLSTPYGTGTFASRTAVLSGGAAVKATVRIRERLFQFASHVLEVGPDDLELHEGKVQVKGAPQLNVPIRDLARWAYHRSEKLPENMEAALEAVATYDAPPGTGTFTNAAQIALVEVDPETGKVEILKYFVVEDCGRMINPLVVEGQIHGGLAQGIGGALYEELVYDSEGQLLTTTFLDYLLPGVGDIPPIEIDHLETPSPFTINGVKGMGEGGAIAPPAVIAGAVEDALRPFGRVFVNEVPLTPERVRGFVGSARSEAREGQKAPTLRRTVSKG
jgi:carbon-monoxide dehydrogenase large subunit